MEINEKASCIPCAQVLQSNSLGQYVNDSEEEDKHPFMGEMVKK